MPRHKATPKPPQQQDIPAAQGHGKGQKAGGKKKPVFLGMLAVVLLLGLLAGGALAFTLLGKGGGPAQPTSTGGGATATAGSTAQPASQPPGGSTATGPAQQALYQALPLPQEMRAVWLSFLEWKSIDFTSRASAQSAISAMMENCKTLGLNTVIVAVRPFGDAFYESDIFPWSHILTGSQGLHPGYDPLQIMVDEAHARGLRIEAWINPYRVQDGANGPTGLSENNPARQQPQLVCQVNNSLWYNPALPQVQALIVSGVSEIVQNYQVDGIHFDDYFYPEFSAQQREAGLDIAFDAEAFANHNPQGLALAPWRRENVNSLVRSAYAAVKAANPSISFGISPQGNNDNNYNSQYSDVRAWMAADNYIDYVMPQLYWGFAYRTASGREDYAFANIAAQWAFYPRAASVRLYAGLGAYRVAAGDGGAGSQEEWQSGHNLADMVRHLRGQEGFGGFCLFRYQFLFENESPLGAQEAQALAQLLSP